VVYHLNILFCKALVVATRKEVIAEAGQGQPLPGNKDFGFLGKWQDHLHRALVWQMPAACTTPPCRANKSQGCWKTLGKADTARLLCRVWDCSVMPRMQVGLFLAQQLELR
jgi:hypothetical protein